MEKISEDSNNEAYNIIGFKGSWFDKENKEVIIISEYASKGSLLQLIQKTKKNGKKINTDKIIKIIYQLIKAIGLLHRLSIIHRDIKPDNIIVDSLGNIKLIDFGISTKPPSKTKCVTHTPQLTRQRSVDTRANIGEFNCTGTPEYMAPEVLSGRAYATYNEKIDIYSLGWTLYSLLDLEFPYVGTKPLPFDTISKISMYQILTYNLYRDRGNGYKIMDREFSKVAYCDKVNNSCQKISKLPGLAIPNMETVNNLFINQREPSPFPNPDVNLLDFFKDCILSPENRLSASQLINKYYSHPDSKKDPFLPNFEGSYMAFGGN